MAAVSCRIKDCSLDGNTVEGLSGLKGMLLGALHDTNLCHYVLGAFLSEDLWEPEAYFDVLRAGAEYVLVEDVIFITLKSRRKLIED